MSLRDLARAHVAATLSAVPVGQSLGVSQRDSTKHRPVMLPGGTSGTVGTLGTSGTGGTAAGATTTKERGYYAVPEKTVETWEERAAHLEYDAGLPRAWAEHFAKLIVGETPGDFSPTRWQAALDGALAFADKWAAEAHRLGWDVSEVFGLHPTAPAARVDCRGLAWLLGDGSQVVTMDGASAEISTRGGGRQHYYRRQFGEAE